MSLKKLGSDNQEWTSETLVEISDPKAVTIIDYQADLVAIPVGDTLDIYGGDIISGGIIIKLTKFTCMIFRSKN